MTKADLIDEIARVAETTKHDAKVIVESILDSIVRALRKSEKVEIRGFGSFGTRPRRARIGRNPKSGIKVSVPAKRVPYFRASKEVKALITASEAKLSTPGDAGAVGAQLNRHIMRRALDR